MDTKRSLFTTALLSIVLVGIGYGVGGYIHNESFSLPDYSVRKDAEKPTQIGIENEPLSELPRERKHILPDPLVSFLENADESGNLTIGGIYAQTNVRRAEYGLAPLLLNETLNIGAEIKVDDMFTQQYFEHVSPDGVDVGGVMDQVGYDYLSVGENLALGNFKNDSALVDAWMDSPGHRANILSDTYTEIGISVKRGEYNGRETWLAVQEFGRPRSDCPQINSSLATTIEKNKSKLSELSKTLDNLQGELEAFTPKRGSAYNQKVEVYNEYVAMYNKLLDATKSLIATYNSQVQAFNICIQ